MNEFNIDNIEEVESSSSRRNRRHHNNYDENIQNKSEQNINNNHNTSRRNRKRRRPIFNTKLGFNEILLIILCLFSSMVVFFSFLINLIITIKEVVTPRIFIPSIIFIILTFLFSGGILGTYIEPPPGFKRQIRGVEVLMMRIFTGSWQMSVKICLRNFRHLSFIHFQMR